MNIASLFLFCSMVSIPCLSVYKTDAGKRCTAGNTMMGYSNIMEDATALLRDGDLVVRMNNEPSSQFIKMFNRNDKTYSHAGIVFLENGYPFVYHVVNGDENPDQKLKKDSLVRFSNPQHNSGFAVFRYNLDQKEITTLEKQIKLLHARGLLFDSLFNTNNDREMYCSELVAKSVQNASRGRIRISKTQLSNLEARLASFKLKLPLSLTSKMKIFAIDNLYTNAWCREIKRFDLAGQSF